MSEQAPANNPEKKQVPLTDDCDNCEKRYALTSDNAHIFHYSDQDVMDNLFCVCPHCNYKTRIFVGKQTVEAAVNNGIGMTVEKNAPEGVYSDWVELKGIVLPTSYELTPRHEALIHKFGESIMAMPPEIFWDNIEAPTDRPYPEKWID